MNVNIDVSKENLYNEGNLWINEKSGQLRYSLSKSNPAKWVIPLSEYKIGNNGDTSETFIKCGQPVSIGLLEDLIPLHQNSADPYIVPTNPSKYQWCIGLALEPGNANLNVDNNLIFNKVHILSHGQIEFNLNDTRPNIFQPPNNNGKYLWTYNDIGKPVYVSNHPDDNNGKSGGLTIDITHAYYNGSNIVSVGRIADAPTEDQTEQSIILEIQLAGDIRGMVDSTQFAVNLDNDQNTKVLITSYDELFFVKIKNKNSEPKGYIIYDDQIMVDTSSNTPIGCFVAKPKNGQINTADWITDGKAVLVHRLGIITGNFNYTESDYGKELFLSGGKAVTAGPAGSYEYKVGLVIDNSHILIDCRFPRIIKKFDAVGTIKPAYVDQLTGTIIADPGYLAIKEGEVHKVSDYQALMEATMFTGLYEFSSTQTGPWYKIDASNTYNSIAEGYFRFEDLIYHTSDGNVISQIKFNNEGAPDDMQYLWPELVFDYIMEPTLQPQGYFGSSAIEFNIDYLVNLGVYSDEVIKNIEFYDIIVKIPQAVNTSIMGETIEGDITVSPGFYSVIDDDGQLKWAGYEWAIAKRGNSWFLKMITKPGALRSSEIGYIDPNDVWGFCWPVGIPLQQSLSIKVYIRRRPIQHHALFLNQLLKDFPWAPFSDGRDLITQDTIIFGKHRTSGDIYSTEYHSRIQIKQDGPVSGLQQGTATSYYASHNIYYSPYFINNQLPLATMEQVIERRIPERVPGSDTKNYDTIEWIYNFKNKKVSLNADFAAHLNFPPTTMDQIDSSGNIIQTIIYSGDYNQGRTFDNISGEYVIQRSALKTLHEIPVGFAEYYTQSGDTESNGKKIVTAQEQWNSGSTVERYLPPGVVREIYPSIPGISISGINYTYDTTKDDNDFLTGEWEHIKQEINLIFNPIRREAGLDENNLSSGGDYQVIQSNVSLLNYAAKETQDRLLKLERAMFGIDAPTLPGDHNISELVKSKLYSYSESLVEMGIIRVIKELFTEKIFNDSLVSVDPNQPKGLFSYYNDIYTEIFGKYDSQDEWDYISSGLYDPVSGKVHQMWIILKNQINWEIKGINTVFNEYEADNELDSVLKLVPGSNSARNIYLYKSHFGYNFEGPGSVKVFKWPVTRDLWNGAKPENRWWDSVIMGTSDFWNESNYSKGSERLDTAKPYISFSSQSVEGILYDIILKLSFLKEQCNDNDKSLKSDFTFIEKSNYFEEPGSLVSPIPLNINLQLPNNVAGNFYSYFKNLFFIPQFYETTIGEYPSSAFIQTGEYTSFGFKNEKIASAWHLNIIPRYEPRNFSNDKYNSIEIYKVLTNTNHKNSRPAASNVPGSIEYFYNRYGITKGSDFFQYNNNYEEYELGKNNLPDFNLIYLYNSSGLAFDKTDPLDATNMAEDINTKIEAVISDTDFNIGAPGQHWYVITYLGKFITGYIHERSDYIPQIYTPSSYSGAVYTPEEVTLPTYTDGDIDDSDLKIVSGKQVTINGTTIGDDWRLEGSVTYNKGQWNGGSYTKSAYTPAKYTSENLTSGLLSGTSGHLIDLLSSHFFGSGYGYTFGYISGEFKLSGLLSLPQYYSGWISGYRTSNHVWFEDYVDYGDFSDSDNISGYFSGSINNSAYFSGEFITENGIVNGYTSGWASGEINGLDNSKYIAGIYKPEKLEMIYTDFWEIDDYYIDLNVIYKAYVKLKKYIVTDDPVGEKGLLKGDADYIKNQLSGVVINNNSGIMIRPEIHGFSLYGAHIPEDYYVFSKIRAKEHVVDQLHLVNELGPFEYPKIISYQNNYYNSKIEHISERYKHIVYWEQNNIADHYIVYIRVVTAVTMDGLNTPTAWVWKPVLDIDTNFFQVIKDPEGNAEEIQLWIICNYHNSTVDLTRKIFGMYEEQYLEQLQVAPIYRMDLTEVGTASFENSDSYNKYSENPGIKGINIKDVLFDPAMGQ
jgi:hypothetical protein